MTTSGAALHKTLRNLPASRRWQWQQGTLSGFF